MSIFNLYFPAISQIAVEPADARALSPAEIQEHALRQMNSADQRAPLSIAEIVGMQQWRRPVDVPAGWSDWFSHGDELA